VIRRNAETSLTHDVIAVLNALPGFLAWRSQAGVVKSRGGGWVHLAPAGTADVVGLHGPHGVFFAVETKATHLDTCKCRTCAAQRKWCWAIEARGGKYVKARTVNAVLRAFGVPVADRIVMRAEVPRGT